MSNKYDNSLSSFFFSNIDTEYIAEPVIERIKEYAEDNSRHIYLINRPLSEKKYDYTVNKIFLFLCPGYNIQFVNLTLQDDEFEIMYEDFVEDLGHIADKYNYTDIIRRPREWKEFINPIDLKQFGVNMSSNSNVNDFMQLNKLTDDKKKRTVKLLISLLTGSINSTEKIGKEIPTSVLEKVKRNIILFDGDQTRFIFNEDYKDKVIKIQGLAGTGKTELLLHRLKEIYITNKESKIVFTCQSKALSNRLKGRVTEFFNFMKVEEQIDWAERLWVMHAWGSVKDMYNLGTYGFICRKYNLPFYTPNQGQFSLACKKTLDYIKENKIIIEPFFDYMLIDEGQDFTDDFIELCSLATKNKVFVAGDIFQDIFGIQKVETTPHYLLNKCYRTDPRTLMFSHALGLALYETPCLRFLKDKEWKACGYTYNKIKGKYILEREPVTRFEEIDESEFPKSMNLIGYKEYKTSNVIDIIKQIKIKFADVRPEDIAIVFPNEFLNYRRIDELEVALYNEFGFSSNILHNTKLIYNNKITITNKNNIKGLEFPFIICVVDYKITRDLTNRNTLYMTLTRSFLSSYLLVEENENTELIEVLKNGLDEINSSLQMTINEPNEDEIKNQESIINQYNQPINQYEILSSIFEELNINRTDRHRLREAVNSFRNQVTDKENLKSFILTLIGEVNE